MLRVKLDHNDFLKLSGQIKAKKISVYEDGVYLSLTENDIKMIKALNIPISIVLNKGKKEFLTKNSWFIAGVILFISILTINNYRIETISFNESYPINERIETTLKMNMRHIGPISFFGGDLQEINRAIRAEYSSYEWITIEKIGTTMSVNIQSPKSIKEKQKEIEGDIYAKKSGVVKYYLVYEGKKNVVYNDYVKQGDILIAGGTAKGYILAETYEEITIKVPKESIQTLYTGKIDIYQKLSILAYSWDYHKESNYKNSTEETKEIFNLFDIIKYVNVYNKEKSDIITVYSFEDAIEYGNNCIINQFELEKVLDEERIEEIVITKKQEKEQEYEIVFLVKKIENIGEFKRREI